MVLQRSLIPEPCEYAILRGKRDFADGIKVTDLKIGTFSQITQVGPR